MRSLRIAGAAHTGFHAQEALRRESAMKPLWVQTVAWVAIAVAAFLLALASPDDLGFFLGDSRPQGGMAPR
jgi:hypothetical protein